MRLYLCVHVSMSVKTIGIGIAATTTIASKRIDVLVPIFREWKGDNAIELSVNIA